MKKLHAKNLALTLLWVFLAACSAIPQENAVETPTVDDVEPTSKPTATQPPTEVPTQTAELEIEPTEPPAELEPVVFSLVGSETDSIIPDAEKPSPFQERLTSTGAALFHEGLFYLFFNDYQGVSWPPTRSLVGYATSVDAESWERHEEPVFSTDDVDWTEANVTVSSVLVEEDGTWTLYFVAIDENNIGRATAPGPDGPWTAEPTPVLEPDEGGWDENGIVNPSVVKTESGYYLYYASFEAAADFGASNGNPTMSIGMATSTDGVVWTKYDDPETAETPYHLSDPVFRPGEDGSWDFYKVESPTVAHTAEDGWVMAYRSDNGHFSWGDGTGYGIALSDDGIHWRRRQDSPVVSEDDHAAWYTLWAVALLRHDGVYYLFTENDGRGVSGTRINLSMYEGLLSK